jgi:predicted transcriptional regulator
MKSILMSIQPKWCELIASGKKTIEVRKTAPKAPFRVFIYQTKKKWIYRLLEWLGLYQQKVIGEFVCNVVESIPVDSEAFAAISKPDCLTTDELIEYCSGKDMYGLHISALKIYDKPRELGEFSYLKKERYGSESIGYMTEISVSKVARPPQSWQYVEEIEE